jgi:acyl-CoA synthetase (AMP-forming)/AMP-acid ligase II
MVDLPQQLTVDNLSDLARQRGARELWVDDSGSVTWAEFGSELERATEECRSAGVRGGAVVSTVLDGGAASLARMFGAAACGAIVVPLRPERNHDPERWAQWFGIDWSLVHGGVARGSGSTASPHAQGLFDVLLSRGNPGLVLATGGTTGEPRLVLHDFCALLATMPIRESEPQRILPLMRLDHIGGLDMVCRALASGNIIVAPPRDLSAASVAGMVSRHRVQVMPATPSFLNLLLVSGAHLSHDLGSLRVVPYGAEPMPSGLLGRLRAALPGVEFVQRFGTSETGSLPVKDNGSGIVLSRDGKGFDWKVVDGELWILSPARALGYLTGGAGGFADDGWFRTGDVVEELSDGSLRVLGRRQDIINVGGEKVLPSEVESLLMSHPLVDDCRVYGVPNALLGQAVAADIVWRGPAADPPAVKRALREFVADPNAQRKLPSAITLVASVEFTGNQKKMRVCTP